MKIHSIEEPHPWLFCIGELNKEVFAEPMQNKMQERLKVQIFIQTITSRPYKFEAWPSMS